MTLIPTLKHKSRASYANAGHGQRRRQEAAKQRGVTPLTYQRMLSKHLAGMNVTQEFTRHACNDFDRWNHEPIDWGEYAAFLALANEYALSGIIAIYNRATGQFETLEEAQARVA